MRSYFYALISLTMFTAPVLLRAQSNPPFSNPSLDSNCYFPQIGVPGEIDTIYGDSANEGLGAYIHNLGPTPDGSPGSLLIGHGTVSPIFINQEVPTGPNFNLHNLHAKVQDLKLDPNDIRFGHFQDRTHLDIFDENEMAIYWADQSENFDTSRKTRLELNLRGSYGIGFGGVWSSPYITHLTDDTLDDIVFGFYRFDSVQSKDTTYLGLFRGKSLNPNIKIAFEDTSILMFPAYLYQTHTSLEGDFRGTGRDDLLITDQKKNLFFFRNDPPFKLSNLVQAIFYDTLWTKPNWDSIYKNDFWNIYPSVVMRALPKKSDDNSQDWLVWLGIKDSGNGIYVFRGGPDFGSHRITIDSAAYVIKAPALGYQSWPFGLIDGGDMTGTGNHVLCTGGGATGAGGFTDQNCYVCGQALDGKIDIFYGNTLAGIFDTLTANADNLEDVLCGNPSYDDPTDLSNGERYHGTIWLMYGSKNIPVHLNPQFADVKSIPQKDGAGITFAPNPITKSWSVATIVWPESEDGEYAVYDMLGREVDGGTIRLLGGPEQQRIYFSNLPQGTYIYVITGSKHTSSTKIVKLSPASGSSGSQPSVIQQMKRARDGSN